MNRVEVYNFLNNLYNDILLNFDYEKIPYYFSDTYIQITDNKVSNIIEFTNHIKTLKDIVKDIKIHEFQDFLYDESASVATVRYVVEIEKNDHTRGQIEVIALFEIMNHKVIRCNEITNPLNQENFKELGSVNYRQ